MGLGAAEEPPAPATADTLHTIQTLLLKLIRRGELTFREQHIGLKLLRENLVERGGREVVWDELVSQRS